MFLLGGYYLTLKPYDDGYESDKEAKKEKDKGKNGKNKKGENKEGGVPWLVYISNGYFETSISDTVFIQQNGIVT